MEFLERAHPMQERSPVSHASFRFDSIVVAVSLVRAVSLECRDESLCIVARKGMGSEDYNCRLETTQRE